MSGALGWVVGRGGLLGSHIAQRLAALPEAYTRWRPAEEFAWGTPETLKAQLAAACEAFMKEAASGRYQSWTVFWAAGAGIVGTTSETLAAETAMLAHALEVLGASLERTRRLPAGRLPGAVFLASSAGGVYGRCADSPATESSIPVPVSDYGRAKLQQEQLLARWAEAHAVSSLAGRISNLYGPGQNLDKPQGLITHLVRSLVLNRPVHLYVSLDTLRDYFHVDDCAAAIVHAASRLQRESAAAGKPRSLVKIFAAEQAASISALIGIISRVTKQRPLVIHAAPRALTSEQPRRLTFRSTVWRDERWQGSISMPVGVGQVYRHLLQLFRQGKLQDKPAPGR